MRKRARRRWRSVQEPAFLQKAVGAFGGCGSGCGIGIGRAAVVLAGRREEMAVTGVDFEFAHVLSRAHRRAKRLCAGKRRFGVDVDLQDQGSAPCRGGRDHESSGAAQVREALAQARAHVLDNGEAFEIGGVGFAGCMGAMGGFGRGMLSSFGEESVKTFVKACLDETMKLETGLRMLRTDRAVAVLHYSPVTDTLDGEPLEIYPFLGNLRLAETIDRFDNVRAVVHGHAHRGVLRGVTPKGVPVYNCARPVLTRAGGRPFVLFDV